MELADLIECPAEEYNGLRLLPSACAQNWKRGKTAQPWDRNYPCQGCGIGAFHAGEAPPDPEDNPRQCCFCGKTYLRLISRTLCISCSNRITEFLSGNYRRGISPPGLAIKLRHFTIEIAEDESCK